MAGLAQLSLELSDGSKVTATLTPSDYVALERAYPDADTTSTQPRMEHGLFLCWRSLTRTGQTALEFEPWLDTVDNLVSDEAPLVP